MTVFQSFLGLHKGKLDLEWVKTHRSSGGPWCYTVDPNVGDASRIRRSPGLSLGYLPPVPNEWLIQGAGAKAPPPLAALQIPSPRRHPPTPH